MLQQIHLLKTWHQIARLMKWAEWGCPTSHLGVQGSLPSKSALVLASVWSHLVAVVHSSLNVPGKILGPVVDRTSSKEAVIPGISQKVGTHFISSIQGNWGHRAHPWLPCFLMGLPAKVPLSLPSCLSSHPPASLRTGLEGNGSQSLVLSYSNLPFTVS